jgi:acyl transferase domain-containing protein
MNNFSEESPMIDTSLDIAVIGLACRLPGAENAKEFWANLCAGVESITRFTPEELESWGADAANVRARDYVPAHAALKQVDHFDASFFGLNPREAEIMDPQHRIFLECAQAALDDAACDPMRFSGLIGVFAGSSMNTYYINNLARSDIAADPVGAWYATAANLADSLSTRTSYALNLRGPSFSVQSACSTSLVAIHLGVQHLLSGACDVALAGGVAVRMPQLRGYHYQPGMILSPDGHCRTFDVDAQGTLPGDGVGVVVLKRLADALADGDRIDAVIKGSAVNNDGAQKVGYAAPGLDGQVRVIAAAQAVAGIDPATISYVEAHGTGTAVGDPIEVTALTQAFRAHTSAVGFCKIGSVKSNFGHLDAAAGVAGFIKTVLALKNRHIPATLHFKRANPSIDFANSPFVVATQQQPWTAIGRRRAAVSAFGMGGTNAHVILEEAPSPSVHVELNTTPQVLLVSAKNAAALSAAVIQLADACAAQINTSLADIAYTLQQGRRFFSHRRAVVANTFAEAVAALRGPTGGLTGSPGEAPLPVAFLFPGQGSQYVGMGAGLYHADADYRAAVDRCAEAFLPWVKLDVRQVIMPADDRSSDGDSQLRQTALTQPALFTLHYATAMWWMARGVSPAVLVGHSSGEYAAACIAGIMSFADAVELVALRGRLMQALAPGEMMAVSLSESEVVPLLHTDLSLAAINSPTSCVVAGSASAIADCEAHLTARGVSVRRLVTSHAFHSHMMTPMLATFAERLKTVRLSAPTIPIISTVTGTWLSDDQATSVHYWLNNVRQPVRFAAAAELLLQRPRVIIEAGPGTTLTGLVRQQSGQDANQVNTIRHPRELLSDERVLARALAKAWVAGAEINWTTLSQTSRRRVALPTYPFQRQRFWILPQRALTQPVKEGARPLSEWLYVPGWRSSAVLAAEVLPQRCLLLAGDDPVSQLLLEKLRAHGVEVVLQRPFDQCDDVAAWRPVLDAFVADQSPFTIICAWLWQRELSESHLLDQGFYALMALARALSMRDVAAQIVVLTNRAWVITGAESSSPLQASALGAVRVIPQECLKLSTRLIDVDLNEPAPAIISQVVGVLNQPSPSPLMAFRHQRAWLPDHQALSLPGDTELHLSRSTWLITGGLGGIGLSIAKTLVDAGAGKLLLLSRTSLLSTAPAESELAQRLQAVTALRHRGVEVQVVTVDVADEAALVTALSTCGEIHGVVHAAGVTDGTLIQLSDRATAQRCLAPKVQGTLALERALAKQPLRYFVLMSSLNAWVGGVGQAAYCAGNVFLDCVAQRRRFQHPNCTSIAINWDAWRDVGMAVRSDMARYLAEHRADAITDWISPADGQELFRRILLSGQSQVVVSTKALAGVLKRFADLANQKPLPANAIQPDQSDDLSADYVPPETPSEIAIAEVWCSVLGVKRVSCSDNFFSLGGHSLLALQVVARLRERIQVEVPVRHVLETATMRDLGQQVAALAWAVQGASANEPGIERDEVVL